MKKGAPTERPISICYQFPSDDRAAPPECHAAKRCQQHPACRRKRDRCRVRAGPGARSGARSWTSRNRAAEQKLVAPRAGVHLLEPHHGRETVVQHCRERRFVGSRIQRRGQKQAHRLGLPLHKCAIGIAACEVVVIRERNVEGAVRRCWGVFDQCIEGRGRHERIGDIGCARHQVEAKAGQLACRRTVTKRRNRSGCVGDGRGQPDAGATSPSALASIGAGR
jgi:hypothetical protein